MSPSRGPWHLVVLMSSLTVFMLTGLAQRRTRNEILGPRLPEDEQVVESAGSRQATPASGLPSNPNQRLQAPGSLGPLGGASNDAPAPASLTASSSDAIFLEARTFDSGGNRANSVAVADVNGDGKLDLLVANGCQSGTNCTNGLVSVLLGNGDGTPTGSVTFKNGATSLGSATLNANGIAALTKTNLPAGSLSVTAAYNGDSVTARSASASLSQTVNQATTTTTVKSSLSPSLLGQAVTFSATVTSPTTTATGSVTFMDGATALGTVTLSAGKASYGTSTLTTGPHTITVVYGGTVNIKGSTSLPLVQTVN